MDFFLFWSPQNILKRYFSFKLIHRICLCIKGSFLILPEFKPNAVGLPVNWSCSYILTFYSKKITVLFIWPEFLGDWFFLRLTLGVQHAIISQCIIPQKAWDGVKCYVGHWINQAFPNNYFLPLVITSDFKKTNYVWIQKTSSQRS